MVSERGILFAGSMVNAILQNRKKMTRRVIKPQPPAHHWERHPGHKLSAVLMDTSAGYAVRFQHYLKGHGDDVTWVNSPYGRPGDTLYVKETTLVDETEICRFARYAADKAMVRDDHNCLVSWWYSKPVCPSIHMPRWASRIALRITDIRIERLQDISEEDARAEGVEWDHTGFSARLCFINLWESIYGERSGCSWASNPWTWIIRFEVTK